MGACAVQPNALPEPLDGAVPSVPPGCCAKPPATCNTLRKVFAFQHLSGEDGDALILEERSSPDLGVVKTPSEDKGKVDDGGRELSKEKHISKEKADDGGGNTAVVAKAAKVFAVRFSSLVGSSNLTNWRNFTTPQLEDEEARNRQGRTDATSAMVSESRPGITDAGADISDLVDDKEAGATNETECLSPTSILESLARTTSASLKIIIENTTKDIHELYSVETKDLGKGAFGVVRKAKVKATGATRAVKFVQIARMKGKESFLKNEIEILKMCDHPNIIKLYELFEDDVQIYMVMELCSGGALLDALRRNRTLTEAQAANAMLQLLRAVYYMHEHEIVHRDIKPANCLIVARESLERSSLRVTDFGLSVRQKKGQMMRERVGTTAFMSPQVINRKYDYRCDIWSCGVTMYMLLCGRTPFSAKTEDDVRTKIKSGVFSFEASAWCDVSEDGMTLIRRLLRVNPDHRASVKEALGCEWLRKKAAEAYTPTDRLHPSIVQNLKGFKSLSMFKRAALCIIASLLDEEQMREARDAFIAIDLDDDGTLDYAELKARLEAQEAEDAAIAEGDSNSTSVRSTPRMQRTNSEEDFCNTEVLYTYTEFLAATFDRQRFCQKGVCWAAFSALDVDGDGSISQQELANGQLGDLSPEEVNGMVKDFDADGDGEIDFKEFMEMMRDGEGWVPTTLRSPRTVEREAREKRHKALMDKLQGAKNVDERTTAFDKISSKSPARKLKKSNSGDIEDSRSTKISKERTMRKSSSGILDDSTVMTTTKTTATSTTSKPSLRRSMSAVGQNASAMAVSPSRRAEALSPRNSTSSQKSPKSPRKLSFDDGPDTKTDVRGQASQPSWVAALNGSPKAAAKRGTSIMGIRLPMGRK